MTFNKEVKDKVIQLLSQNKDRDTIIKELNISKASYYRILKENKENKLLKENDLIIEKINNKKVDKINYDLDIKKAILDMIPKISKYFEELNNNNKLMFQYIKNNYQETNKDLSL